MSGVLTFLLALLAAARGDGNVAAARGPHDRSSALPSTRERGDPLPLPAESVRQRYGMLPFAFERNVGQTAGYFLQSSTGVASFDTYQRGLSGDVPVPERR
jgi:hypothetical protein